MPVSMCVAHLCIEGVRVLRLMGLVKCVWGGLAAGFLSSLNPTRQ
jgi:hypothetical protein